MVYIDIDCKPGFYDRLANYAALIARTCAGAVKLKITTIY